MENQSSIKNPSFSVVFGKAIHPNGGRAISQEHGSGWELHLVRRFGVLECNSAKCVWALEEELTAFTSQIETPDARVWLAEVMAALKQEELTRVVVSL